MSGLEKDGYLDLYYQMVLIRRIEERSAELYQQGKIGGFLHLYIGQEAVSLYGLLTGLTYPISPAVHALQRRIDLAYERSELRVIRC